MAALRGLCNTKKEFAQLLGVSDKALSSAMNGSETYLTKSLLKKVELFVSANGLEPEPDIDMAFGFLVNQFRIDNEKYRIRCEKNRDNIISRWEREGKDTNEYNRIQTNTKHTDNDNENENDNENGKGNGNDSRNGNLTLPFTDPVFVSTWNELLAQPNWKRKTTRSLKMALNQLAKYDVRFAVTLMESSIVGNYKGVTFPDTPAHYEQWQRANHQPQPSNGKVVNDIDNLYND